MIGVEIQDETGAPAPALRDRIIELAFHRGLLLLPCGPSTVRICPPLCLTSRQVEIGVELLDAAMTARPPTEARSRRKGRKSYLSLKKSLPI